MINYPMTALALGAIGMLVSATLFGGLLARAGFPLQLAERRIGYIDGLRGYLALSVLMHHFVIWLQVVELHGAWSDPRSNPLNALGAGGVGLFFMITGLVFYPRVLTGYRATRWRAVFVTRAFRIVPLLTVSVAMIMAIIAVRTGARPSVKELKSILSWLSAWSEPPLLGYDDSGRVNAYVLWSILFEWVFYFCLLPVLFAVGMLAYEVRQRTRAALLLQRPVAAIVALGDLEGGMLSAPTHYAVPQLILFGFFFVTVACGNNIFGVLHTKGALVLGECSYGIYLFHGVSLSLVFVEGSGFLQGHSARQLVVLLPLIAVAVVCVASLTYIIAERPMSGLVPNWLGA